MENKRSDNADTFIGVILYDIHGHCLLKQTRRIIKLFIEPKKIKCTRKQIGKFSASKNNNQNQLHQMAQIYVVTLKINIYIYKHCLGFMITGGLDSQPWHLHDVWTFRIVSATIK